MEFKVEGKEFLDWEEFRERHKDCEFTSTIGGKFSFTFTPTGLGNIIEVKCNACKKEEDITNIDYW